MPSTLRFLACAVLLIGCTPSAGQTPEASCEGPLGPPISISSINAMTACCQIDGGKAHCLSGDHVPSELQPFVAACDSGGYCLPDNFLETGASRPPATCSAFGGAGVCLSVCIPSVSKVQGFLQRDTCQGVDELCAPCLDPRDGTDTHACDLLELATCVADTTQDPPPAARCDDPSTCNYEASCPAVIEPSLFTACGPDAHCLDAALVTDPAQSQKLAKCDDASKLCVPDIFIKTGGKFTPATCKSVNDAEGRCLSTVIPDVKRQAAQLPQDTCAASEKCTPCFDPITGMSTGACNLSCDTGPTEAAMPLAQCCGGRARCVPTSSIPDDQEDQLSEQECEDTQAGSLCVPVEIINNGPFPTCTASSLLLGNYAGVCLSNCLDFGIQGIALARGSCSNNFKCAPCVQNGQPTGAPGCPP